MNPNIKHAKVGYMNSNIKHAKFRAAIKMKIRMFILSCGEYGS